MTPLIASWERSLRSRKRAPKTIRSYGDSIRGFIAHQASQGRTLDPAAVTRGDVEDYIADQLARWTPSTAATRYRGLQQWWKWLIEEDEIAVSPMVNMKPPSLDEAPVPVFTDADLRALLGASAGKGFLDRRDTALVRVFMSSGVRLAEAASMRVADVDLDEQVAMVHGKGDRWRWVPLGDKAVVAVDRYLRVRARHRLADDPALWLATRGGLTDSGIDQALRARASAAGVAGFHVHRFRHTFAHRWLASGGEEGDLQELAGWRSPQMLARYGASARSERARAAYRRVNPEGNV